MGFGGATVVGIAQRERSRVLGDAATRPGGVVVVVRRVIGDGNVPPGCVPLLISVGPTSGGTWVVGDHAWFLTDSPCHAGGVTYGYRKIN